MQHSLLMDKIRVMIIEDEDLQYEIYEECLGQFELKRARSGTEAIKYASNFVPEVIVLDHVLENEELGLDFLPDFKQLMPHVPIVVVSGALEVQQQIEALQGPRRAHYCLPKPVDIHVLKKTIQTAVSECGEKEVIKQFESLERSKRSDIETLLSRSTDRLSRQHQIRLRLEDFKQRPNISALAREYRVARRTIIRDLQEMIRRGELDPSVYPKWDTEIEG
ncbi:MAG: response regulator [Verrucomicrobia bacterium]|jgi:DNA-binding NtrC family response regulator|nr:response regulator [Verrucomicrobiota bacterium]MBT4276191.1 response regulator [Verrucomicrobiota bacterium]MBT5063688.1 response regulator [Verrucomicrobiota bacterium]MBT5480444.1 response regulator [Verrucomicrobiota bacterium]MBT6237694.1 response regulator [Verrucomicrobiota bacterium]